MLAWGHHVAREFADAPLLEANFPAGFVQEEASAIANGRPASLGVRQSSSRSRRPPRPAADAGGSRTCRRCRAAFRGPVAPAERIVRARPSAPAPSRQTAQKHRGSEQGVPAPQGQTRVKPDIHLTIRPDQVHRLHSRRPSSSRDWVAATLTAVKSTGSTVRSAFERRDRRRRRPAARAGAVVEGQARRRIPGPRPGCEAGRRTPGSQPASRGRTRSGPAQANPDVHQNGVSPIRPAEAPSTRSAPDTSPRRTGPCGSSG